MIKLCIPTYFKINCSLGCIFLRWLWARTNVWTSFYWRNMSNLLHINMSLTAMMKVNNFIERKSPKVNAFLLKFELIWVREFYLNTEFSTDTFLLRLSLLFVIEIPILCNKAYFRQQQYQLFCVWFTV